MKTYSSRDLLKILKEDGWIIKNQEGSHLHLVHPTKPGKVTIPHPKQIIREGTVHNILKQAGLL